MSYHFVVKWCVEVLTGQKYHRSASGASSFEESIVLSTIPLVEGQIYSIPNTNIEGVVFSNGVYLVHLL